MYIIAVQYYYKIMLRYSLPYRSILINMRCYYYTISLRLLQYFCYCSRVYYNFVPTYYYIIRWHHCYNIVAQHHHIVRMLLLYNPTFVFFDSYNNSKLQWIVSFDRYVVIHLHDRTNILLDCCASIQLYFCKSNAI